MIRENLALKIRLSAHEMLGVSLGASTQQILSIIDRKISILKKEPYSIDILRGKKQLLDLISKEIIGNKNSDPDKATIIDRDLLDIDLEDALAVAGLAFLLEAGGAEECLQIYNTLVQQKEFYRTKETTRDDLEILCDQATLIYSSELRQKRFYESAASVLEARVASCKKKGREFSETNPLITEINNLLPYRILDLLSRSEESDRMKGIRLLKLLLEERGGLANISDQSINNEEFIEFFKQIRGHLTLQEQIAFYRSEREKSGELAKFLECTALVACGFSQRKPQRIAEALSLIKELHYDELRLIEANIYLLLGDVQQSSSLIKEFADDEFKSWLQQQSKDNLASLCYWCHEWLERDVLNGYRDVDVEPDLDAYFCDKDVVSCLDSYQKRKSFESGRSVEEEGISQVMMDIGNPASYLSFGQQENHREKKNNDGESNKNFWNTMLLVTLILISVPLFVRFIGNINPTKRESVRQDHLKSIDGKSSKGSQQIDFERVVGRSIVNWQTFKKNALSGLKVSTDYKRIASDKAVKSLDSEVRGLIVNGERKLIDVSVLDLQIKRVTEKKAVVIATIKYQETLLNQMVL